MDRKKILLIIAARGGSKGVKDKNVRPLCGLPLICHTINQAREWGRADDIICSTDSDNIAEIAKKYGAEILFKRPAELSGDKVCKMPVLRHAAKTAEEIKDKRYDIIIDLDVTAPIRRISDIEGAYDLFLKNRPKSVFSAVPSRKNPYFNMVELDGGGYAKLSKEGVSVKRRQDAPKVYDMNASIYVYDRKYLLDGSTRSPISDRSLVFVMDDLSAFDIDGEADFLFIEFLVSKGLVKL